MGRKRRLLNSPKFKAKHAAHPRLVPEIPEVELVVETTAPEPEIAPECTEKTEATPTLQQKKPKPKRTRKRTTSTRSRSRKKTTTQNKE
jgi:hypothetical protein